MLFGRHAEISGLIQTRDACTGWEVSTAAARARGAGLSLPQVRRAQPFKVKTWRAGQREPDSILSITKGSAASSCSWGALLERPLHRYTAVPLPAQSGTLLSGFWHSIIRRLQQRRQYQQQHDLTPPRQGASHLWPRTAGRGKEWGGWQIALPAPASPTKTSTKAFPGDEGLHSQYCCVQPPSSRPLSSVPLAKLTLGPILLNNLAAGCFCKLPAPKEK